VSHGKPFFTSSFPFSRLQGFAPPASPFIRLAALTASPEPFLSWVSPPPRVSQVTR
jgi:hypothetical protein